MAWINSRLKWYQGERVQRRGNGLSKGTEAAKYRERQQRAHNTRSARGERCLVNKPGL